MPTKNTTDAATDVDNGTGVSVTLKGGAGYDAPWIVVRAGTPAAALELLNDEDTLTALSDAAAKAGQYFAGLAPATTNRTAAASSAENASDGKKCPHGVMQWKSGFSAATGKAWQGYFCPSPKGTPDQCKPEFQR